jgi:hypothetical protein
MCPESFQIVTLVRPSEKHSEPTFLCRFPKSAEQLREQYKVMPIATQALKPIGSPENLLDGSLFFVGRSPQRIQDYG